MKKRGLGRNLQVLLSRPQSADAANTQEHQPDSLQTIALHKIQPGRYQPRKDFSPDSLRELADSIRAQGILQPIVIRLINPDHYEIIAGERRWRAAQLAELKEIPVIIKDISDESALAVAIIENIQREDLNPIEEAVALQRLLDEFGMTHQQVADAVGKSRTTVTNLLRLLGLQSAVREMVETKQLEMGHARTLLTLTGQTQLSLARKIVEEKLSVRETESLVSQAHKNVTQALEQVPKRFDPAVRELQQKISLQLGSLVLLKQNAKGHGKMVIHYKNKKELEGIVERLMENIG